MRTVLIRRATHSHSRGHGHMRTYRRAALAAGLMLSLVAPVQAQTAAAPAVAGTEAKIFDARQMAAVGKVNEYFNALVNLKAAFQQTNPDGKKMRGTVYVKKPGRFRFDYNKPSQQIVISDGKMLAVQDLDGNADDRYELDNTPFRMLLKKDVDLLRDARILDVQDAEDSVIVTVMDKSPDAPGKIKLFFGLKPAIELKEWVTTDGQNLDTRVELSGINRTDDIDAARFDIRSVALNKLKQQQ